MALGSILETIGNTPMVMLNRVTAGKVACQVLAKDERLESVLSAFERGKQITVVEEGRLVGILTKIDVIDFLTGMKN